MRALPAVLLLSLLTACASAPSGKQLFNGSDMAGWTHVGDGEFLVEDGALKTTGGMGLLYYDGEPFGNSVVRVVYKPESPDSNAGVFIRIPEKPQDEWYPVHNGYEVQIQDSGDEFHRTGSIYSLSRADSFSTSGDGWNVLEITLRGQTTEVAVNGNPVNSFEGSQPVPERKKYYEPQRGPRPDVGYIGLQNHDEASTVWFKEVSIHPLPNAN